MIGKDPETLPTRLFNSYKKHLNLADVWKNKEPGVELIYIETKLKRYSFSQAFLLRLLS